MKQDSNNQSTIPFFLFEKFDYGQDIKQIESKKNSYLNQEFNFLAIEENFEKIKDKIDLDKLESYVKFSFNSFDNEKKNEIDILDIKNCLYNMNLCPNNSQLSEIYKQLGVSFGKRKKNKSDENNYSKISYPSFSKVIIPILAMGELDTKSEQVLKNAFLIISDGDNKIDWKKLEELMCSLGDKFKNDEIECMKEFVNKYINKNYLLFKDYVSQLNVEIDHESFFKNSKNFSQKHILQDLGFNF